MKDGTTGYCIDCKNRKRVVMNEYGHFRDLCKVHTGAPDYLGKTIMKSCEESHPSCTNYEMRVGFFRRLMNKEKS